MLDAGYYPNPVITGNNAALADGIVVPANNFIEVVQTVELAVNKFIEVVQTVELSVNKFIEVPQLVVTIGFPQPIAVTIGGKNKNLMHPRVASYEWGTPGSIQPVTGSIAQYRVTRDQEEYEVPFVPPTLVT